jgi:hypothetical protein
MITVMKRIIPTVGLISLVFAAFGCSSDSTFHNPFSGRNDATRPKLAAYAAQARYPDVQAATDLNAGAIVNRQNDTVRIINFSDRALIEPDIWVNGSFVQRAGTVPARGIVTMARSGFYDSRGNMLNSGGNIQRIDVQTRDGFWRLLGPVRE